MRKNWDKKNALKVFEWVNRPIYYGLYPIAKFIYQYTSITPNMITIFNVFVGLAGLFFLASSGNVPGLFGLTEYQLRLIGGVLAFAYVSIDSLDGQLARGGKLYSRIGAFMDSTMDSIIVPLFMFSLAIGLNNDVAMHT